MALLEKQGPHYHQSSFRLLFTKNYVQLSLTKINTPERALPDSTLQPQILPLDLQGYSTT